MEVYSVLFDSIPLYDSYNKLFSTLDKAINHVKEFAKIEYGVEPLEIDRNKDISVDFQITDIVCAYITKEEIN